MNRSHDPFRAKESSFFQGREDVQLPLKLKGDPSYQSGTLGFRLIKNDTQKNGR